MIATLADPGRGWDAIVIGEYERAFSGSQHAAMTPLFEHYDVQLWTPEAGRRIDYHAEDHEHLSRESSRTLSHTWPDAAVWGTQACCGGGWPGCCPPRG